MNSTKKFRIIIFSILVIAVLSLTLKIIPLLNYVDNFYADDMYDVTYRYFYKTQSKSTTIKSFLPQNNSRQQISNEKDFTHNHLDFSKIIDGGNVKGVWISSQENKFEDIDYRFTFEGKAESFDMPLNFQKPGPEYNKYLEESENIQVSDSKINSLAKSLSQNLKNDKAIIKSIYNHVYQIPAAPIISLTDAVTTLEQNRASCNGKSRLLVAMARNLGYPARIKGGIILEEANKRTSHSWAELYINGKWVPFDPLNNHFAYIPANYLELYIGDEFMITYTSGINFDYIYEIKKQINIPFLSISANEFDKIYPVSLWGLVKHNIINLKFLIMLLLIPIGGLIVAFLRNVIGLKTFGVFLPVLISFSLIEVGLLMGMISFIFLILFVGVISRPFEAMGLLNTPKLVISLSLMVIVMLGGSFLGMITGVEWLTSLSFFPVIILTISAEKFSSLISEEGFMQATNIFSQTLIAVLFCYFMISSKFISSVIILFPEFLLIIIALAMLLGRYIGLRWTELIRFKPMLTFKTFRNA